MGLDPGSWSFCQLADWQELNGIEPIAFCSHTIDEARVLTAKFDVPHELENANLLPENYIYELDFC